MNGSGSYLRRTFLTIGAIMAAILMMITLPATGASAAQLAPTNASHAPSTAAAGGQMQNYKTETCVSGDDAHYQVVTLAACGPGANLNIIVATNGDDYYQFQVVGTNSCIGFPEASPKAGTYAEWKGCGNIDTNPAEWWFVSNTYGDWYQFANNSSAVCLGVEPTTNLLLYANTCGGVDTNAGEYWVVL